MPDEFLHPPPPGHLERALYLKHIDIRGRLVQPPIRYDRVEGGCLFLEYLISTEGPQVRKHRTQLMYNGDKGATT